MPRLVIGSTHRYADLARLWHRWVTRDLVPAFTRSGFEVEVNIFRDANAAQFRHLSFSPEFAFPTTARVCATTWNTMTRR